MRPTPATARWTRTSRRCAPSCARWRRTRTRSARTADWATRCDGIAPLKIGLRILLGTFLIVALAGLLLAQVFVQQVKPGVRQTMEDTLVDTANVLAELARDDLLAGTIDDGRFARSVRAFAGRDIGADIWGFEKRTGQYRIYVTDARGTVVFDSTGEALGQDYSQWNDVHRTLRGAYGARSTRSDPDDDGSSVMHVAAP